MAEVRAFGLRRLRAALAAITLSFGGLVPHCSEAAESAAPCGEGFLQHDPVALGCSRGNKRIKFELTEAGTPHHLLLWQAPAGTQSLRATATLSPSNGGRGKASLKVACSEGGKVLVGPEGTLLNHGRTHAKLDGSHWQWGRDSRSSYGEPFEEWFRVNGTLPCDIEVSLSNDGRTRLVGDLQYEWSGISPCPEVPLGCRPCSDVEATCSDRGQVAVCDGSPFVQCTTEAALKAAGKQGCCYTYFTVEGNPYLETNAETKGECSQRAALDKRGDIAFNTTCPVDAEQAGLWLGLAPQPVPAAATTALPTTSLAVPLTYELAGAFALEIQTSMDVSSDAFHSLLLAALAEGIGIHVKAFERFKVVSLGTHRRLLAADGGQSAEVISRIKSAEAATGSEILGVGYEVASGSVERQMEIQTRLNNMGGPSSRVRASLTDILSNQGVSLIAIQVTYPAAPVAEIGLFRSSTPLPAGRSSVGEAITVKPAVVLTNQPSWASTTGALGIGAAALCGLVAVIGCCAYVFRERVKSKSDAAAKRSEEAGRTRPDVELGATQAKGRYEPVSKSEDASFNSVTHPVNRPPSTGSVASDSSEAAGLRLLGNDGM